MDVVRALPDVGPQPEVVADFDTAGGNGCGAGCVLSGGDSSSAGEPGGESSTAAAAFVRPGGDIRPPRKLQGEVPAYPDLARLTRVEGEVVVECMIDERGRVLQVQVLRGHRLLAPAAAEAVKGWVYQPTLLNGVPVQVLMTVTVQFQLR
jgi:protein TonB